jgi:hypothetical protein
MASRRIGSAAPGRLHHRARAGRGRAEFQLLSPEQHWATVTNPASTVAPLITVPTVSTAGHTMQCIDKNGWRWISA